MTTPTPPPAAPATTAMVMQELTDLRDWMQSSPTPVYVPTIPLLQSAITHLTALSQRCAALEEDGKDLDWLEMTGQRGHYCGVFRGDLLTRQSIRAARPSVAATGHKEAR